MYVYTASTLLISFLHEATVKETAIKWLNTSGMLS